MKLKNVNIYRGKDLLEVGMVIESFCQDVKARQCFSNVGVRAQQLLKSRYVVACDL